MTTFTTSPGARPYERGSLLIVAMLLSAIIALSLGSFLSLASQATQLSYRSFYAGSAMNVAETGLEQGMWAINKRLAGDTNIWSNAGWSTVEGSNAVRRTFDLGTLSGGATAQVKVYVSNANLVGFNPFLLSRSIITPKRGTPIERWIKISLTKRSRFSTGLVAKETITFSGTKPSVDSYDSRLGAYNAALAAGGRNRYDRGTAGSASLLSDTVDVGNTEIWGFAVVGTSDDSGIDINNGSIGPFGTASGVKAAGHVLTDFTANFDDVQQPAAYTGTGAYSIGAITDSVTLPRPLRIELSGNGKNAKLTTYPADVPAADGKYYYNVGNITLGGNGQTLTIANNVVIRLTPTTGDAIKISGNSAGISINPPVGIIRPKLEIFTEADVSIGGSGVANNGGKPENFLLWGTRPQLVNGIARTPQTITIHGNGNLASVVYAPNADLEIKGGGNADGGHVYGSMIGKTVRVTGNSQFHYDEALGDVNGGEGMGMSKWTEYVTYADRTSNAAYVSW
jgi:hypothetical protein